VQTSCGFGVPLFSYEGERPSLDQWAKAKGPDGIEEYRREKNAEWYEDLTTENNNHVMIGKENYFMSADGYLMPAKKGQQPPELMAKGIRAKDKGRDQLQQVAPDENPGTACLC